MLFQLGLIAQSQGDDEQARALAEAARAAMGTSVCQDPFLQRVHERMVESTRATLGEALFVAAWEEGRAMPLEQAIACALEEPGADTPSL